MTTSLPSRPQSSYHRPSSALNPRLGSSTHRPASAFIRANYNHNDSSMGSTPAAGPSRPLTARSILAATASAALTSASSRSSISAPGGNNVINILNPAANQSAPDGVEPVPEIVFNNPRLQALFSSFDYAREARIKAELRQQEDEKVAAVAVNSQGVQVKSGVTLLRPKTAQPLHRPTPPSEPAPSSGPTGAPAAANKGAVPITSRKKRQSLSPPKQPMDAAAYAKKAAERVRGEDDSDTESVVSDIASYPDVDVIPAARRRKAGFEELGVRFDTSQAPHLATTSWSQAATYKSIPLEADQDQKFNRASLREIELARRAMSKQSREKREAIEHRSKPWREGDTLSSDSRWSSKQHFAAIEQMHVNLDSLLLNWNTKVAQESKQKYQELPERMQRVDPDTGEAMRMKPNKNNNNDMLYRMMESLQNQMKELSVYNEIFKEITRPEKSQVGPQESASSVACPSQPLCDLLDRIRLAHEKFYPQFNELFDEIHRRMKFDWILSEMKKKQDDTMKQAQEELDKWQQELTQEQQKSLQLQESLQSTKSQLTYVSDAGFFLDHEQSTTNSEGIRQFNRATMLYDTRKRKLIRLHDPEQIEQLNQQPVQWYGEGEADEDEAAEKAIRYDPNRDSGVGNHMEEPQLAGLTPRSRAKKQRKIQRALQRKETKRVARMEEFKWRHVRLSQLRQLARTREVGLSAEETREEKQLLQAQERAKQEEMKEDAKEELSEDGGSSEESSATNDGHSSEDEGLGSDDAAASRATSPSKHGAISMSVRQIAREQRLTLLSPEARRKKQLERVDRAVARMFTTRPLLHIRPLQSGDKRYGKVFANSDYYMFELADMDPGVWIRLFATDNGSKYDYLEMQLNYGSPPTRSQRFFVTSTQDATSDCAIDLRQFEMLRERERHNKAMGRSDPAVDPVTGETMGPLPQKKKDAKWYLRILGHGCSMKKYVLEFRIQTTMLDYSGIMSQALTDLEMQSEWQNTLNDKAAIVDRLTHRLMPSFKQEDPPVMLDCAIQTLRKPPLPPMEYKAIEEPAPQPKSNLLMSPTATAVAAASQALIVASSASSQKVMVSTGTSTGANVSDPTDRSTVAGSMLAPQAYQLRTGIYKLFTLPRPATTALRRWHPKAVFNLVKEVYQHKILADSVDDLAKNVRQNLAQFFVDYMKNTYGIVSVAESYLWEFVDTITTRSPLTPDAPTVFNSMLLYHFARLTQIIEPYLLDENIDWYLRSWKVIHEICGIDSAASTNTIANSNNHTMANSGTIGKSEAKVSSLSSLVANTAKKNASKVLLDAARGTLIIPLTIAKDIVNELYVNAGGSGTAAVAATKRNTTDAALATLTSMVSSSSGADSVAANAAHHMLVRVQKRMERIATKSKAGSFVDRDQLLQILLESSLVKRENYVPRLYNYWKRFNTLVVPSGQPPMTSSSDSMIAPLHHPSRGLQPGFLTVGLYKGEGGPPPVQDVLPSEVKSWVNYHEFYLMMKQIGGAWLSDIEIFYFFYKCLEWQNAPIFMSAQEQVEQMKQKQALTDSTVDKAKINPTQLSEFGVSEEVYRVSLETFVKVGHRYAILDRAPASLSFKSGLKKSSRLPPTANNAPAAAEAAPIQPQAMENVHLTPNSNVPFPNHILTDDELNTRMKKRAKKSNLNSIFDPVTGNDWLHLPDPKIAIRLAPKQSLKLFLKTFRYCRPVIMHLLEYVEHYCVSNIDGTKSSRRRNRLSTFVAKESGKIVVAPAPAPMSPSAVPATHMSPNTELKRRIRDLSAQGINYSEPVKVEKKIRLEIEEFRHLYDQLALLAVAEERAFLFAGIAAERQNVKKTDVILTAQPSTSLTVDSMSSDVRLLARRNSVTAFDENGQAVSAPAANIAHMRRGSWSADGPPASLVSPLGLTIDVGHDPQQVDDGANYNFFDSAAPPASVIPSKPEVISSLTHNFDGVDGEDVDYELQAWASDWYYLTGQTSDILAAAQLAEAERELKSSPQQEAPLDAAAERRESRRLRAIGTVPRESNELVTFCWNALRDTVNMLHAEMSKRALVVGVRAEEWNSAWATDPHVAPPPPIERAPSVTSPLQVPKSAPTPRGSSAKKPGLTPRQSSVTSASAAATTKKPLDPRTATAVAAETRKAAIANAISLMAPPATQ